MLCVCVCLYTYINSLSFPSSIFFVKKKKKIITHHQFTTRMSIFQREAGLQHRREAAGSEHIEECKREREGIIFQRIVHPGYVLGISLACASYATTLYRLLITRWEGEEAKWLAAGQGPETCILRKLVSRTRGTRIIKLDQGAICYLKLYTALLVTMRLATDSSCFKVVL